MKLFLIILISWSMSLFGQEPSIWNAQVAGTAVNVESQCYHQDSKVLFLHLHQDESTSIEVLKDSLNSLKRYCYFTLRHNGQRNINGRYRGRDFKVDPNRIFTQEGSRSSFEKLNNYYSQAIVRSANRFGRQLISKYLQDRQLVVAVHNNTEGAFSIISYLPGGESAGDAKEVHRNESLDPDNFYLTTEKAYFDILRDKGFNVVLQDNSSAVDDGSLSVYCGRKNIPYINIEVERGDYQSQRLMISVILDLLRENALDRP